jgi:hypothetical protein
VLAADQRITWWATQLHKAGLDGDMDVLRARAFLDILLGIDSSPHPHDTTGTTCTRGPGRLRRRARSGRRAWPARRWWLWSR